VTRKEAFIALNMIPRLGPVRLRRLLEIFHSPDRLLSAKRSELQDIEGLNQDLIDSLVSWESVVDLQQELSRIHEFGATILTLEDADYPALLREIHDPPTVLYVWGNLELRDHHAVGVVGSRRTSHYGLECAKKISYQIAYAGWRAGSTPRLIRERLPQRVGPSPS
jgi:DNA processing protein